MALADLSYPKTSSPTINITGNNLFTILYTILNIIIRYRNRMYLKQFTRDLFEISFNIIKSLNYNSLSQQSRSITHEYVYNF